LETERLLLLLLLALLLFCLHCEGVVLVGELGAWEGLPTLSSVLLRSRISRRKECLKFRFVHVFVRGVPKSPRP
jgi:hypothetical protein